MLTFWGVVAALTFLGGGPAVVGLWTFERRRSRRRNQSGECAACGASWHSEPSSDPYLIHGRLVCEDCAQRARRRMPWHFGILALAASTATGLAVVGAEAAIMILLPAGSTVVMTAGAMQLMKLANQNAQRRIASGEYPEMKMLKSGVADSPWEGRPGRAGPTSI